MSRLADQDGQTLMAFIPQSLYARMRLARERIVAREVEQSLTVEHVSEEEEVREYDDQQRLRSHRTTRRRTDRGAATLRRRDLALSLENADTSPDSVRDEIRRRLDSELRAAATEASPNALARYAEVVPSESWPWVFAIGTNARQLRNELTQSGFTVQTPTGVDRLGVVKFSCPPEGSILASLAAFRTIGALDDPDATVGRLRPARQGEGISDHRALLRLPLADSVTSGAGVTVAVLDTGVDQNHSAFTQLAQEDYRDFTGTGLADDNGHGTHVASIVAGRDAAFEGVWSGIAPGARLVVAKVLPENGLIPLEVVLEAMAWALFEKRADIISMSIGDDKTDANGMSVWTRACEEAARHGAVVCIAAGNVDELERCPNTVVVPGDAKLAVTVGAIGVEGYLAPFSAMGNPEPIAALHGKPTCVAPGVNVAGARSRDANLTEIQGTRGLYTAMSGTSMAAPMVAGCLALLKSRAKSLGWDGGSRELVDLFYAACRPFSDEKNCPYSPGSEIGHGLPDMGEALAAIERKAGRREAERKPPRASATRPTPRVDPGATCCASCGISFTSSVGVFSPTAFCNVCRSPICTLCWTSGNRFCEDHSTPQSAEDPAPPAGSAAVEKKESIAPFAEPSVVEAGLIDGDRQHLAESFLNGFDTKVRQRALFRRPGGTNDLIVSSNSPFGFVRPFGRVLQHECKSKRWLGRTEMLLSAIALNDDGLGMARRSSAELLQQIIGKDGLPTDSNQFQAIGVLSVTGWPAAFRTRIFSRSNIELVFVEPGEATAWNLYPANSQFADLFDPEPAEQKLWRAAQLLANYEDLVATDGVASMDSICRDTKLPEALVEAVVKSSAGKFRLIEGKGKKAVVRASGV
jgi:subtilisin family serine protease